MKTKVCGITITHPNKVVFGGVTKLEIVNYYNAIAPRLIKAIGGRPLSAIRCHNGHCFFKKHPTDDFVNTVLIDGKKYFYLTNKKPIINEVQLGTVEFHPWGCNFNAGVPNLMVFDLDPDEALPLSTLRKGVKILKTCLNTLNLKCYLKTSGGKGYHIMVPIKARYSWTQFSNIAKQIAEYLTATHPTLFTTSIKKAERKNKIFIDYLRNKKAATCVAAYSLRARDGAPIPCPLRGAS